MSSNQKPKFLRVRVVYGDNSIHPSLVNINQIKAVAVVVPGSVVSTCPGKTILELVSATPNGERLLVENSYDDVEAAIGDSQSFYRVR